MIKWNKGFPTENMHCLVVFPDGEMCVTPFVVYPRKDHYGDWGSEPKKGWVCLNVGNSSSPIVKGWIPVEDLKEIPNYPLELKK